MPEVASIIGQTSLRSHPLAGGEKVRAVDAEKRTIDLAFSSEAECDRGWYIEVLSHDAGACDLSRLLDSAPFLLDHDDEDRDAHIGVVESAEISADRRGRARVRLSKRSDIDGILTDIADGIRPHVSVRYRVLEAREIGQRDGIPIVRIDRWQPLELSSVSVPFDHTVGVGRSLTPSIPPRSPMAEPAPTPTPTPATTAPATAAPIDGEAVRSQGRADEQARVKAILTAGEKFKNPELARQFVENGKSVDEFRVALLESIDAKRSAQVLNDSGRQSGGIGMTKKEAREFSFLRLLRVGMEPKSAKLQEEAAFEMEACRAAADASGKAARGFMIPVDVLRAMSTDTTGAAGTNPSTGGLTIEKTLRTDQFIDLLRKQSLVMGMGTTLSGLVGNIDIPKQLSELTGVWIGEDGDAGSTEMNFGLLTMSPKTVAGMTEVTRRLLMQSSQDVEGLVRRELALALANAIDEAAVYGTGSSNQPRGVANQSGLNSVTFAAAMPTYAELVAMETELAADDALMGNIRYLINPVVRGHAKTTVKFSGTNNTIWEPGDQLNGYDVTVSNRMKKTVASGAVTTTDVLLGNWQELIVATWGGLDLLVDPYTNSEKGRIRIVVHQDADIGVKHPESFVLGKK